MKNNDFDFIKQQFEKTDAEPSERLSASNIVGKLEQSPEKKISFKAAKKRTAAAVIAACVAIVAIVGVAGSNMPRIIGGRDNNSVVTTDGEQALECYSSYDEIQSALKDMNVGSRLSNELKGVVGSFSFSKSKSADLARNDYVADGVMMESQSETVSASDSYGQTYLQVQGVDEPDQIKTNGKYIFYMYDYGTVCVYSAKGEKSEKVAELEFSDDWNYSNDMFIYGDKLVVIASTYDSDEQTKAIVYDISNVKKIKELDSFAQSGNYVDSRISEGNLYLVSNDYAQTYSEIPVVYKDGEKSKVACGDIVKADEPSDPSFLVISRINLDKLNSDTETKAILGAGQDIYCNGENLYVTVANYPMYKILNYAVDGVADGDEKVKTQIIKASVGKKLKFTATGKVTGTVIGQYAFDEHDGNLRVAVTTRDKNYNDINVLYVLDKNLKQIGKTESFAKTESIKAVKYIGDYAYVITYEQTDPLFVIDLSDPTAPEILGEAKIDGFSTMLVPVGDDRLLGIGYSTHYGKDVGMEITDGLKLVVFDISDKLNPKVIAEKELKGVDSDVQYNPRVLLYNPQLDNYAIPVNRSTDSYEYYNDGGAIVFSVTKSGKISIDKELHDKGDRYSSRVTYVNDDLYILYDDASISSAKY